MTLAAVWLVQPTVALAGYAEAVMSDSPNGYWRLGEASATVADDQTTNANHGS